MGHWPWKSAFILPWNITFLMMNTRSRIQWTWKHTYNWHLVTRTKTAIQCVFSCWAEDCFICIINFMLLQLWCCNVYTHGMPTAAQILTLLSRIGFNHCTKQLLFLTTVNGCYWLHQYMDWSGYCSNPALTWMPSQEWRNWSADTYFIGDTSAGNEVTSPTLSISFNTGPGILHT